MLTIPADKCKSILCIGAHADDIEIGCGGTILHLSQRFPAAEIRWLVFSANETRRAEARTSFQTWLADSPNSSLELFKFRDGYMPSQWAEIKDVFQVEARNFNPDLVFTHHLHDRHQDHRLIAELTWNAFRSNLVLEYEIPKYEGDLGKPNLFVPLSRDIATRKMRLLSEVFPSQQKKFWYDNSTFESLLRIRGIECRQEFAEAFHSSKTILDLG